MLTVRLLESRWRITEEVIRQGLSAVDWPGRWQRTRIGGRFAILDASHNAEGAGVLDANLSALAVEFGRAPVVIVGVLGVERAEPLIRTICRHAKEIHFVVPEQPRAVSHENLESCVPQDYTGKTNRASVAQIFPGGNVCTAGTTDDVIVVTGSIYLLGDVLRQLRVGSA
jgi:dihydrofolate synthase/folylpolyglutamate synthase